MAQSRSIGKYELLDELGHGGFATVYQARDPRLDRVVAVKVLHSAYADRPDVVQRFLGEASKAVGLRHRGIVRIYAVDEDRGVPYIAMEYLPGGTLADRLRGEPLPLDAVVPVVEQVAAALDYAHKRGLVHRDVKPANVLFDDEGQAVLVDFGLVKSLAESGMTTVGTSLGTPYYMAPEQADPAAEVDARTDVYALGVVAYEMLAGRVPFEAENPLTVLHAHAHEAPPDPRRLNPALDEGVAAAVLKALEKAPAGRHRSAGAFARALRGSWEAARKAAQAGAVLADLYAQAQEAMKENRWGVVVNLCVEMRDLDPNYRDVGTLLTLAARRLAEEEQKRQREQELGEQYEAALELLAAGEYADAANALGQIAERAPDFREVEEKLAAARAGLEKAQMYEAALVRLAEGCPDEACAELLALLELEPGHAEARARLLEATEGVLAQLKDAWAELEKVGGENEVLCARVAELEEVEGENEVLRARVTELEERVDVYDSLLLALEEGDQGRMLELARGLAQGERAGAGRLLARLVVESRGDLWVSPTDGKEMVRVPAGEFLYGDEKQKLELPDFWIDRTPVTNAEYARFVAATGHKPPQHWKGKAPPGEIADHPVTYVSWHDAVAYAGWAGKRLPPEKEWEKAARGTDGRKYPWGDQEPTPELCSFDRNVGGTTPVGKYSPQGDSPCGCVDMAGNVWEWTASDYSKGSKVLRGGSWGVGPIFVRGADRDGDDPDRRLGNGGFRCARGSE